MAACPFCADAETSDWRCFCDGSREMSQESIDRLTLCPACHGEGWVRHSRWGSRDCPSPDEPCPMCQPELRTVWAAS